MERKNKGGRPNQATRKTQRRRKVVEKIDFQAFVNGLPYKFLQCRADGHGPWRALTVHWDNEANVYERHRRCGNCGTTKPQFLDSEGYIVHVSGSRYAYPDGYLAKHVDLPPLGEAKAAYRLAATRHQMAQGNEPRSKKKAS